MKQTRAEKAMAVVEEYKNKLGTFSEDSFVGEMFALWETAENNAAEFQRLFKIERKAKRELEAENQVKGLEAQVADLNNIVETQYSNGYSAGREDAEAQLSETQHALDCMTTTAGELQDICDELQSILDNKP